MGCECQQSQTRGFSIGVFISSCLSSPLPLKQKLCCGWKLSWAGPSCLWALLGAHPSSSFPALLWGCPHCGTPCSADPVPCCRCNIAVNQLQLKAHQQICLFFPPHLPSLTQDPQILVCIFPRACPACLGGRRRHPRAQIQPGLCCSSPQTHQGSFSRQEHTSEPLFC